MWESLSQISALGVFLVIAFIGFLFLVISLVFGEVFEHFEFAHDLGHDLGHGGPSIFSVQGIAVFITTFGAVGAIGSHLGYGVFPSSGLGFISGIALAALIYFFASFLYGQQASSTTTSADLVGRTAQVTVGIPDNGVGQVRCLVGETMVDKIARSRSGNAIAHNSAVKIEEIVGESVIVSPVTDTQKPDRSTQS
jgi:membrane protein implicated in regulation of membrane protease activity